MKKVFIGGCVIKSERLSGDPKSFKHAPEDERIVCTRRLGPDHRIRLSQVRELAGRFGLRRPEHVARVLSISSKEAENLMIMAGISLNKD